MEMLVDGVGDAPGRRFVDDQRTFTLAPRPLSLPLPLYSQHVHTLPSHPQFHQHFESERIRALEAKREQRKTATIRSAACYPCQICGQTDVRRELDCTPSLARINTDYDPGSVVSTAQSTNFIKIYEYMTTYNYIT